MDVARLNMSHGTLEEHRENISRLRRLSRRMKRPVGILLDLQGIRLRLTEVRGPGVVLRRGQEVRVRQGRGQSTAGTLSIPYSRLLIDVREGHRILINDGLVELLVTGQEGRALKAVVKEGGLLTSRKGVNLPDSVLGARSFTSKDRRDLLFGIREGVDAVALSFVTAAREVETVRRILHRNGHPVPVIAKIERPGAVDRIEEILDAAEGIMVARGDLGVELPAAEVPILQKDLIRRANRKQKLVITATQMLESMILSPVPTRAEAADVANAVLDGSDAVMLSGETSVGKHPLRAVRTMDRIVREAEGQGGPFRVPRPDQREDDTGGGDPASFAVADAAVRAARDVGARCIAAFTRSGYTAGLLASFRPERPIVGLTSDPAVVNRMMFTWGVVPLLVGHLDNTDAMIRAVERVLLGNRFARRGETVVITASLPMGESGRTNFLKVHRIP